LPDLHADSRLRDMDTLRSGGECPRLDNGRESSQLSDFHRRSLYQKWLLRG
jgi:hypothetical protein